MKLAKWNSTTQKFQLNWHSATILYYYYCRCVCCMPKVHCVSHCWCMQMSLEMNCNCVCFTISRGFLQIFRKLQQFPRPTLVRTCKSVRTYCLLFAFDNNNTPRLALCLYRHLPQKLTTILFVLYLSNPHRAIITLDVFVAALFSNKTAHWW